MASPGRMRGQRMVRKRVQRSARRVRAASSREMSSEWITPDQDQVGDGREGQHLRHPDAQRTEEDVGGEPEQRVGDETSPPEHVDHGQAQDEGGRDDGQDRERRQEAARPQRAARLEQGEDEAEPRGDHPDADGQEEAVPERPQAQGQHGEETGRHALRRSPRPGRASTRPKASRTTSRVRGADRAPPTPVPQRMGSVGSSGWRRSRKMGEVRYRRRAAVVRCPWMMTLAWSMIRSGKRMKMAMRPADQRMAAATKVPPRTYPACARPMPSQREEAEQADKAPRPKARPVVLAGTAPGQDAQRRRGRG